MKIMTSKSQVNISEINLNDERSCDTSALPRQTRANCSPKFPAVTSCLSCLISGRFGMDPVIVLLIRVGTLPQDKVMPDMGIHCIENVHILRNLHFWGEGFMLGRWHPRHAQQDSPTSDSLCQERPELQT